MINKKPIIIGTGSFVPERLVTNEEVISVLRPINAKTGQIVDPDWLERYFGIKTRAFDISYPPLKKKSREEGGIYDGDLAIRAAQAALDDAGVKPDDIDTLVHVTCTPDTIAMSDHIRYITQKLGLRKDIHIVYHNLGCAGPAAGIKSVTANILANTMIQQEKTTTALMIASNCTSGYTSEESARYYNQNQSTWAWLSAAVFGDGAGALVFRLGEKTGRGVLDVWYETYPEKELIVYPAGGCLNRTSYDNVGDHLFVMDPRAVSENFPILAARSIDKLQKRWSQYIEPIVGYPFEFSRVKRWYIHQANALIIKRTVEGLGIPLEDVPINVDKYGNTSAASTLILLDEDRRNNKVSEGDLVVFFWIGAGNGAMHGYSVCIL